MNALEVYFADIQKSNKSENITPQNIVRKYGVTRRGWRVNEAVNYLLNKYELNVEPDFADAYFYSDVKISPKPTLPGKGEIKKPKYTDPIPKLGLLKSSNLINIEGDNDNYGLISVRKETSIIEAISLMIQYNFSQLPILSGRSEVYGLVSWKSIGKALSLGKVCEKVADCCEPVEVLKIDEPLLKAVNVILQKEVVLVKDLKNEISGILTATDIGEQFLSLSEPFLIIEQIENIVRQLLDGKLTLEDIEKVLDSTKLEKEIKSLSDLNFGHYVRIIENQKLFEKLKWKIDRVILKNLLEEANKIRNEVMHFQPEAMEAKDLNILRQTLDFLSAILKNQ